MITDPESNKIVDLAGLTEKEWFILNNQNKGVDQ